MMIAALGLVYRYGTKTLPQNDEVWVLYDAGPGMHLHWLWKTWAEHRIPLAKFIWKGVLQLTDYDFRFGNFLTVFALAGIAGVMMWTARKIRGRTIFADAFFPLAILNFGQAQVFLWWWQINHVLAPIVACALLAVLMLHGNSLRLADIRWIGIGLIVLVLCGPGGLPYVVVFTVWLFIWIATPSLRERQHWLGILVPIVITLALLGFYFVNYTPYFPVNDPPSVPSWPPPAGVFDSTIASLQILGVGLGIATKPYALFCGFAIFALGLATTAILIQRALKQPSEHLRALGLLLFLGAAAVLVFVIGRSRAGMGLDYIYQGHYLILVVPALCCIYFAWEIQGGAPARLIQFALLFVLAALLPLNLRAAIQIGQDVQQKTAAFEHDVRKGIPAPILAERHFASDVVPRADKLALILKDHKANGIGLFREIRDDPAVRAETVNPADAVLDRITLRDRIASASIRDNHPTGSLTWTQSQPRHIYAIRLRYAYIQAANVWPTLHVYWRNSRLQDFNVAAAFFSTVAGPDQPTWALIDGKIQTNAKVRTERTLTMWVDTKIDQFRIYLDSAPCDVRFSSIELLVPAS
jgi:hypothetical protein